MREETKTSRLIVTRSDTTFQWSTNNYGGLENKCRIAMLEEIKTNRLSMDELRPHCIPVDNGFQNICLKDRYEV
jgi:predicted RNA-binding protein with PIN domain